MALIGSLAVNILAKTNKFDKPLKKSGKEVFRFKNIVKGAGDQLKMMSASMLAVVGAGPVGLAAFAKQTTEAAAQNIRFARGLGLTAAELGNYHRAAARVGVETDVMNDALLELKRRSAEATTGTGSLYDSLQVLNIDAEKFVKMRLPDQFTLITKRLDALSNSAQKAFLTDEIFGGASDTMTGLTASIRDAADEMNRLGQGLSADGESKILGLDADIKELTASLSAISKQFLIDITPAAIDAVKGLTVIMENAGLIKKKNAKQDAADEAARLRRAHGEETVEDRHRRINQAKVTDIVAGYINFFTAKGADRSFAGTAPADVVASQKAAGVWLPQMTEELKGIRQNTSSSGGGVTLKESDM